MGGPYVKSGSRKQPQKVQRHASKYVRFQFCDANGALVDCDSTPVTTFRDASGAILIDFGDTPLENENLTNESTGIYYYALDTKTDASLDWVYAFPKGLINGETVTIDQGIPILIISEEDMPSEDDLCGVADVESKLRPRNFGEDTNPTRSDVQIIVTAVGGDMRDYLKASYTDPITGTRALARLRNIAAAGAAAQAEMECPRKNYETIDRYQKMYDQAMKEIKNGTMPLTTDSGTTGAEAVTTLTGMVAGLGTDTSIADDDKGPIFSRDDEW